MKIRLIALLSVFLFLGACATAQPQLQIRYGLDQAGDLVEVREYVTPPESPWDNILKTTLIIGGSLVGVYVLGEVFDVWDDDDPAPAPAPSNPLIQTGGEMQSSWSGDFIQPVYQPL